MCVLLANQELRCWGDGSAGAHGYGHTMNLGDDELPAELPPLDLGGGEVVGIAAGGEHVCARKQSGALRCWGFNSDGQLGYGHTMNLGDDEVLSTIGNVPYE
jgi:alpha-tubulin suppressor-like RCC1 family protein